MGGKTRQKELKKISKINKCQSSILTQPDSACALNHHATLAPFIDSLPTQEAQFRGINPRDPCHLVQLWDVFQPQLWGGGGDGDGG